MGEKNKEISGLFSDYFNPMLGKSHIRLNNLKTSLRFPCLGLNPIIDSISLTFTYTNIVILMVNGTYKTMPVS